MDETLTTFERLVSTLESSERQEMLRQIAESSEIGEERARVLADEDLIPDAALPPPRHALSEEPFFVRLWFTIRALFSSSSPERLYSAHLVAELGRRLARTHAIYIDVRHSTYTAALRDELARLRDAQSFFAPLLSAYANEKGDFYIVLASFMMKNTCDAVAVSSDPFAIPYRQDQKKDVRSFLLREMETVLQSIPEEERARMYQSAQAIEWVRLFCDLPIERMILRFGVAGMIGGGASSSCLIDSISEEMKALVSSLASARRIPILLLEAMFLFARRDEIESPAFDIERECRRFVKVATGYLVAMRDLKETVPLADFARFSIRDVTWAPALTVAGEDWFQLFRTAWKRRFEEKWTQWNFLHRKAMLERDVCALLEVDEIHPLRHRPWDGLWMPLSLRRELTLSFLKELFSTLYPARLMRPLKILLIEGDFYRRENLAEYTDAFSALEHQLQAIDAFEERLSPEGDIGEGFALVQRERLATVKGKARLEGIMLSTDAEACSIIDRAVAAFRSIDLILGGVLDVVRGGPYETLVNMASIQGKYNERYRKELAHVRQLIREAQAIIADADAIERESL